MDFSTYVGFSGLFTFDSYDKMGNEENQKNGAFAAGIKVKA